MDALQALLGAKPATEITDQVKIKRLGAEFTIKALTGEDIDKIRDQATYPVKNGKKTELKVNEEEVARLLILKATVEPNFANADLLKHFGASDAGECVQKALLAGEIATLQTAIGALSGFDDEEEIEEIKN
ncbi:putative XkdN-related protein [uncultured Caudovirales phage]|uniref:Putative XkdN-related protein n=1 Tax=uncultured Caudovirales phage TaxID=2100421 RepID=A0A2H4J7P7_9CAUD|nr:putative XkdN-related protein [uncultured Caudovirales phage]